MGVWITLWDRYGNACGATLVDAADAGWVQGLRWYRGGCRSRYAKNANVYLHRMLCGNDGEVDHINRDTLDNRRCNLRVVSHQLNMQNVDGIPNTSSQYRGVTWDKTYQRWRAQACLNDRGINLGRFDSELDAATVVAEWRSRNMPGSREARLP